MLYHKSSSTIPHVEKNLSNSHDVIGIVKYFLIYTKIEGYLTKGISKKNFFYLITKILGYHNLCKTHQETCLFN